MLKRAVEYYASKSALNIEGLGEKNVEALIDAGLVGSIADLYTLTAGQVEALDRFAEISAHKLVDNIQASKNPPLAKFITAIGIRHIGTQTAIDLAAHFKTLEALRDATESELIEMPGIGKTVAESILAFFADEDNLALLDRLKELGVEPVYQDTSGGKLNGLSFVRYARLDGARRGSRKNTRARRRIPQLCCKNYKLSRCWSQHREEQTRKSRQIWHRSYRRSEIPGDFRTIKKGRTRGSDPKKPSNDVFP